MPAAGLNRALRPRQTRRARLKRELSWPRPGGMAISLAGAALVFCGAWSLDPTARSTLPSPVVAPVSTPTTPDTSAEPAEPSLTGASSAVTSKAAAHSPRTPASLMGSGGFASPIAPLTSVSEVIAASAYFTPESYMPKDLVFPAVQTSSAEAALLRSEAATATTSARPGFTEHQTGFALDIGDAQAGTACDFSACFVDTAAAQRVVAHGARHGFIVRYITGEEATTG